MKLEKVLELKEELAFKPINFKSKFVKNAKEKLLNALRLLDRNATLVDVPLNNGIYGAFNLTVNGNTEYWEGDTCLLDAAYEWRHALKNHMNYLDMTDNTEDWFMTRYKQEYEVYNDYLELIA